MRNETYVLSSGYDVVGVGSLSEVQAAMSAISLLKGAERNYLPGTAAVTCVATGRPLAVEPCELLTAEEFEERRAAARTAKEAGQSN